MLIELIKKDISFSLKWFLIALLLSVFLIASVLFKFEDMSARISIFFYLLVGMLISRICYTEDNPEVKVFLKSLPISSFAIVLARYIILFTLTIIAMVFSLMMYYITSLEYSTIILTVIIGVVITVYFSLYLYFFYRFGFYYTRIATTLFAMIVFGFIWSLNRFDMLSLVGNANVLVCMGFIAIALCVIGILVLASIKAYSRV